MLVTLTLSHLLMPAALTLLDYHYCCLRHVRGLSLDRRMQGTLIKGEGSVQLTSSLK
jgi:hypothetical protein